MSLMRYGKNVHAVYRLASPADRESYDLRMFAEDIAIAVTAETASTGPAKVSVFRDRYEVEASMFTENNCERICSYLGVIFDGLHFHRVS